MIPDIQIIIAVSHFNDFPGHSPATYNRFKRIMDWDEEEIRPY